MSFKIFPKRTYTEGVTPIVKLENLSRILGGPTIYMKREDLLGLAAGGNKTRKLEYLMADALQKGADAIITCGAIQSNHCRLTLSAAVKEGLECHLVLEERVKGTYDPNANGNNFLYKLLGAKSLCVIPNGSNIMGEMEKLAEQLCSKGKKPYIITGGGSDEIGTLGYVSCAREVLKQMSEEKIEFTHIVTTIGSCGTYTGLLVGMVESCSPMSVIGISVHRSKKELEDKICSLADKLVNKLQIDKKITKEMLSIYEDYIGEGYSMLTEGAREAICLVAQTEGILLDPVYTGKTMAGLIDLVRKKQFKKEDNILFMHTGGIPDTPLHPYSSSSHRPERPPWPWLQHSPVLSHPFHQRSFPPAR